MANGAMKERASQYWNGLSSKKRMALVTTSGLGVIMLGSLMLGFKSEENEAASKANRSKAEIVNASGILEESLTERVENKMADTDARLENTEVSMTALEGDVSDVLASQEDLAKQFADVIEQLGANDQSSASVEEAARAAARAELAASRGADTPSATQLAGQSYPPPPIRGEVRPQPVGLTATDLGDAQILGGIASMPAGMIDLPGKTDPGAESVYLAPGMMNAILLTGVDALASQNGTDNPEPILFRVQAPAVLPNYVRANLQGCFVIGNATASLAKERVEVRAVSLSCIDYEKRAVVDEPIKGFLVDTDGKKGLSGKVVTKAGAVVGRAFLGGLVEGLGNGVNTAAGSVAVSPLGGVQTYDSGDIAQAGIGEGFAEGGRTLSEYYLELAEQLGPVIEVGAAKEVVLVIQEGVNLNIKRDVNVVQ